MTRILINTGGWVRELPAGTAFVRPDETTFAAWDEDGNELELPPFIPLDDPPWFRRVASDDH